MIRRALLGGAAALLTAGLALTPASAQESIDGGEWAGSRVARPATVTSDPSSTLVEGSFTRDRPYALNGVEILVTPPSGLDPACPHGTPRTIPATYTAEEGSTLGASTWRFSAGVPFGPRACNGSFSVRVTPDVVGEQRDEEPVLTTVIDVAVPPLPVVGVVAERTGDREVEVSWSAPADPPPDLLGFTVIRTAAAGDVTTFQLDDPAATSFTDDQPPAEGGEVRYQVVARRWAPAGEVTSSGGEAPTAVEVEPAPQDEPTGADPGDGDTGSSSSGDTGAGGAGSGGSGGSGGSRVRRPLVGSASSGFIPPLLTPSPPTTVDDGFSEELPFDEREGGEQDPVLPDDQLASAFYEGEAGRGLAIPVATALVLAVWAFHLRYLARAARPTT